MTDIKPKSPAQIEAMRRGGKILATILQALKKESMPGVTPRQLSISAKKQLKKHGAKPAFLGFQGYPDVICISVNSQVQHSIPTNVALKTGDILNLDFGVSYQGMVTDAGISFCIGNEPDKAQ